MSSIIKKHRKIIMGSSLYFLDGRVGKIRNACPFDGKVSLEAAYMRDDIPKALAERGFKIDLREPMSFYLGCIQLVLSENEEFIGVADPRRDGSAGAPEK